MLTGIRFCIFQLLSTIPFYLHGAKIHLDLRPHALEMA
jgi:hypothetical protein